MNRLTLKALFNTIWNVIGNMPSTPLISLENLAKILPIGVISKKTIGSRSVFSKRHLCIFAAASSVAIAYIMLKAIVVAAEKKSLCLVYLFPTIITLTKTNKTINSKIHISSGSVNNTIHY